MIPASDLIKMAYDEDGLKQTIADPTTGGQRTVRDILLAEVTDIVKVMQVMLSAKDCYKKKNAFAPLVQKVGEDAGPQKEAETDFPAALDRFMSFLGVSGDRNEVDRLVLEPIRGFECILLVKQREDHTRILESYVKNMPGPCACVELLARAAFLARMEGIVFAKPQSGGAATAPQPPQSDAKRQNATSGENAAPKGGCFIATACYGSYEAPEVLVLRRFRDERLLSSVSGSWFVNLYYRLSPQFANWLKNHSFVARAIRSLFLNPLAVLIRRGQKWEPNQSVDTYGSPGADAG